MARSITVVPVVVVFAVLLIASPHVADAITCGQVTSSISQCLSYAKTGTGMPPSGCCSGVKSLNSLAKTSADRQTACKCLKTIAGSVRGLKPAAISGIPGKCGVRVPFPISTSTDCSK
ncbi:non-specific lipid-transfer protein 1-like [Typha angustifolia]|uniref:non-specific lipid-transfer protein 1-like n=1 Tax=Typha angustifolia TaxID=59011 RepID=UPI003C2DDF54